MLQLLPMTDVTDTQTVPAVQPTLTAASGVMTRNASQQTVTAARSVLRTDGESPRITAYHLLTVHKGDGFAHRERSVWGTVG